MRNLILFKNVKADDGSFSIKAFASKVLKDYLAKLSNKHLENLMIYTCGPEIIVSKKR